MARKKRKKLQKKQFLSLFESKNYQKLISKAKQFEIEDMSQDEVDNILKEAYLNLANDSFNIGDIARAIRDINSLLLIDDSNNIKLLKVKYLCYIENFNDALKLAKELMSVKKDTKLVKEAIFLYLLANLYTQNYEIDLKLLKKIPISREKYILGLSAFMQDDRELALNYFNESKPRAKIEKENIETIKSIISQSTIAYKKENIKPLYRFLLSGNMDNLANTKNIGAVKKDISAQFKSRKNNEEIEELLDLDHSVSIDVIKNNTNETEEGRLIYNNIILLLEENQYNEALTLFIQYKSKLVKLTESGFLLLYLIHYIQDSQQSTDKAIEFISSYLFLHNSKISSSHIDMLLLSAFKLTIYPATIFPLVKKYNRDNFIFLKQKLIYLTDITPSDHDTFNKILKKFKISYNSLLDEKRLHLIFLSDDHKNTIYLSQHISKFIEFLIMVEQPHYKYKKTLFMILTTIASLVQDFNFNKERDLYMKALTIINQYIKRFRMNILNLSIDLKALFISIDREESIKQIVDKPLFSIRDLFMTEGDYDFNETEYDILMAKKISIENLENNIQDSFKPLKKLKNRIYQNDIFYTLLMDLLRKAVEIKYNKPTDIIIKEILSTLNISLNDKKIRDSLVKEVVKYAITDINIAILIFRYALLNISKKDKNLVWYLSWLDGYINLVDKYKLEKDQLFKESLDDFFKIQEKKKFKSIDAKYRKNVKKFR